MNNRILIYLTLIVLAGMAFLIGSNLATLFHIPATERFLKYNDVQGIEITHNDKPYLLNFTQQNGLVTLLNQALPTKETAEKTAVNFSKITIYRFNAPTIELIPVTIKNKNLLFSQPEWNANGLLEETSNGELLSLISQTFDS